MINPQVFPRELARTVIMHAITHNQRTGQYLFNMLQEPIRNEVTGKDWDPFEKEMSQYQIEKWFEDHIVFGSDGKMIALFDESGFLWERK